MLARNILMAAILLVLLAPMAHAQARQDLPVMRLPDAQGAQLVMTQCAGVCHGADRFAFAQRSPEAWRRTVLEMVSNGAQLFPDEIEAITQYFATNLGDKGADPGRN